MAPLGDALAGVLARVVAASDVRVSPELEAAVRERVSALRSGRTEASFPGALPREK